MMSTTQTVSTSMMDPSSHQAGRQLRKKAVKGGEPPASVPIFLRKTFHLIDTCDQSIASWHDNGETFVVKDTEKFATEVIPEFFKHNNFSSFVRQLNFYGFRKIKSDPLRLKDAQGSEESRWWQFRHSSFKQGRPDLLVEIKKATTNDSGDKREIAALKNEVRDLKDNLRTVTAEVEKLKLLVGSLIKQEQVDQFKGYGNKKRKMAFNDDPLPIPSMYKESFMEPLVSDRSEGAVEAQLNDLFDMGAPKSVSPSEFATDGGESVAPAAGQALFSPQDEDMLSSLFALDTNDGLEVLDSGLSSSNVDAGLVNKVRSALEQLPKDMQSLFVDRIVAVIANPHAMEQQVQAMTTLAACAADEAQRRLVAAGRSANDKHCPKLASAVLGAYLSRYSAQEQQQQQQQQLLSAQQCHVPQAEQQQPAVAQEQQQQQQQPLSAQCLVPQTEKQHSAVEVQVQAPTTELAAFGNSFHQI